MGTDDDPALDNRGAHNDAVDVARALLRGDLVATQAASPRALAALNAAVRVRRDWVAAWPAGAAYVPCLLAQDLQEALHAELDARWPLCPEHRDHALFIEPDLGTDPFWVCHRSGLPIAAVGGL